MSLNAYRKPLLGGVILVLGGWYAASNWLAGRLPATVHAMPEEPEISDAPGPNAMTDVEDWSRQRQKWLAAAWPENPFRRAASETAREVSAPSLAVTRAKDDSSSQKIREPFVLNAIIGGTPPLARIDETIVKIGDSLTDNFVVVFINADSVILQGPDGTHVLQLAE